MFRSEKKKKRESSSSSGTGFFSWMGNLTLFFVIILALISIPFLILVAVLSIRTIQDYWVWILSGILATVGTAVFLLVRSRKRIRKRFEKQKEDIIEIIQVAAREGHNVNISVMHGLIRLDLQGRNDDLRLLEGPVSGQRKALPLSPGGDNPDGVLVDDPLNPSNFRPPSVSAELERLSRLMEKGLVTEAEFQQLKARLLKTS
ncbi:MAG: SHOCT domain-containing protein [Deltaproteobacteria bacterium]|nr:MAG: SHOCT domain-containing protein [Deltaproteobacteria bacterium]